MNTHRQRIYSIVYTTNQTLRFSLKSRKIIAPFNVLFTTLSALYYSPGVTPYYNNIHCVCLHVWERGCCLQRELDTTFVLTLTNYTEIMTMCGENCILTRPTNLCHICEPVPIFAENVTLITRTFLHLN